MRTSGMDGGMPWVDPTPRAPGEGPEPRGVLDRRLFLGNRTRTKCRFGLPSSLSLPDRQVKMIQTWLICGRMAGSGGIHKSGPHLASSRASARNSVHGEKVFATSSNYIHAT